MEAVRMRRSLVLAAVIAAATTVAADAAPVFETFVVSGARSTDPMRLDDDGVVTGSFVDMVGKPKPFHGFVRSAAGTITTFDVAGAGTGQAQGTHAEDVSKGVVTGSYVDSGGNY